MPRKWFKVTGRKILVLALIVVVFLWCISVFVCHIPSEELTRTRLIVIQRRIIDYYSSTGAWPQTLIDLPSDKSDVDNSLVDAWGRSIVYRVIGDHVVLESMGRDGNLGGTGQDSDLFIRFTCHEFEMPKVFSASLPGEPVPK